MFLMNSSFVRYADLNPRHKAIIPDPLLWQLGRHFCDHGEPHMVFQIFAVCAPGTVFLLRHCGSHWRQINPALRIRRSRFKSFFARKPGLDVLDWVLVHYRCCRPCLVVTSGAVLHCF
jgi:hypothetical protein